MQWRKGSDLGSLLGFYQITLPHFQKVPLLGLGIQLVVTSVGVEAMAPAKVHAF